MQSEISSVWAVMAAALVVFLQAGLAAREVGFARSKNTLNVAVKHLGGAVAAALVFWVAGFGLMFGATTGGWVGTGSFIPAFGSSDPTGFLYLTVIAFVVLAIVSGAVAERVRFVPFFILSILIAGVVFPIAGHWALNPNGWLRLRGFVDFAGGTVVHSVGGWIALAALLAVGPRAGRFSATGEPVRIPGSNLPFAVIGTFLIVLGFIGMNGGRASLLEDGQLERVIGNTLLAGAAGGVMSLLVGWTLRRAPEIELSINGLLAGLVASAAGAHAMSAPAAVLTGGTAGLVAFGLERLLLRAKIDDAVGAVPVHLGGGVWGALCAGIFGHPALLHTEMLSRGAQVKEQAIGVLATGLWSFLLAFGLFKVVGAVTRLRVSPEDEARGLNIADLNQHTEAEDLVEAMEEQARTGDISARAPVEPFTEMGRIARHYNRVLETVQFATAQTESLVRTSMDGLITFNTEGMVTSSNPAASAIFGYSEKEFRSVSVTALFAPSRDKTKGRADLGTLLATFVGQAREVRGIRRNGEECYMEAFFNYVSVGEDEIYTATFRDITQRKETEEELAKTQAEIRRRLEQELEDAKVVQNQLLPVEHPVPGCEIARHYQSASETGGDWYGYHHRPDTTSITFYMGDVTGHGLPSALLSGVVCGAVYSSEYTQGLLNSKLPATERSPDALLRNIADVVNRIVLETGKGELLMTMAFMNVNLKTGKVSFLNAGHNMPWVVRGKEVQSLVGRGSRLGESNKPQFEITHLDLVPNDIVVLYTDGLIENEGPSGRTLSMREVQKVLSDGKTSAVEVRDDLVHRAREVWQDRPAADDHSVLVFRWTPPGVPAAAGAR
jgi:ammonium transporter